MTTGMPTRQPKRGLFALTLMLAATSAPAALQDLPGLVVEDVLPDSAAAKAGLRVGDRVVSYDDQVLPSPAALQAIEENTFNKDTVVLHLRRGDEMLMIGMPRGTLGIHVRPPLMPAALTLYDEGRAAQQAQRTDDVIVKWTAAAHVARGAGDTAATAWLYGRVGEIREGQRQWKDASAAHAAAWELLQKGRDVAAQSRALVAMGRCSQNLNDIPLAEQWYRQASEVDATSGNELWVATDLNLAGIAIFSRNPPAAHDYFTRALSIRERLAPDSLPVAASLHNLGTLAWSRGDLARAPELIARSLAIKTRLAPDSLDVAASLTTLGSIAYVSGDLSASEDYNVRALALHQRLAPDSLEVAANLTNLGNIANQRGDLTGAHNYYSRSLAIKQPLAPDSLSVATSFANLGVVARARGDLSAAEDYHRRALALREWLAPESLSVATTLVNLGNVARSRGEFAVARGYFGRALAMQERLSSNSLDVAGTLNSLGQVARFSGDAAEARHYYDRALAIKERLAPNSTTVAESLHNLGLLAVDEADLTGALNYLNRALALRERLAPRSLDRVESLTALGHVALKRGRMDEAVTLFARAVDIVEEQRWQINSTERRALLLEKHADPYAGLLRAHMANDNVTAAFATAERARARSLLEILTENRAEIRQGVDAALLQREHALQQQLNAAANRQTQVVSGRHTDERAAALTRELDALLRQYHDIQAQIRRTSPRYGDLTQPQPLDLEDIQKEVLDADTLLLEYVLGAEASYVFAVTPTSIRAFDLPKQADIETAARRVHALLTARQPVRGETARQRHARIRQADADYPATAVALSRMVLGPVFDLLSNKRLVIVADGALQYVPFGALPEPLERTSATGRKTVADATPLMVNHEIVSLPSASVLGVLRRDLDTRPQAEKLIAVLADPVFDSADSRLKRATRVQAASVPTPLTADLQRTARAAGLVDERGALSRLPFTRDEADAIVALAPAGQSTKATDFSASRATATSTDLSRYRIIHLATHGVLDTERPELSGIVLSLVDEGGTAQDGFLRLHEIYNLNWSADLVVLSACQTALGKEIKGEGLVGLTRGFMYGGARRVVASLWNVNDSASAQFMRQFYQGLLAKDMSPAEALRAAQIEMWKRQQWRSPYYWGAFVLQGEWR